jgi:hypothetical protein
LSAGFWEEKHTLNPANLRFREGIRKQETTPSDCVCHPSIKGNLRKKLKKSVIECRILGGELSLKHENLRFGRKLKSRKTTRRSSLQNRKK